MKTNKKSSIIRKGLFIVLIIASVFSMVACSDNGDNNTYQEYELVSCYIENRNVTNGFGGTIKTTDILHYGYIAENREVVFDEQEIVSGLIEFEIAYDSPKETPKVIIKKDEGRIIHIFRLSRDMYKNINNSN